MDAIGGHAQGGKSGVVLVMLLLMTVPWCPAVHAQQPRTPSRVAPDETVVLFPTWGKRADEGWLVSVHGWIFELEEDSAWRAEVVDSFGAALGLTEEERRAPLWRPRALRFVADNERGKEIGIQIAGRLHVLPASGPDGHFRGEIAVTDEEARTAADKARGPGWIKLEVANVAELEGKPRAFAGIARLIDKEGLSVISDVDDTLKVSEVGDLRRLLLRTFVLEQEAVPGMSMILREFESNGASIHYVTAMPWQLQPVVGTFFDEAGFPPGTFDMRSFRFKEEATLNVLRSPAKFKSEAIRRLITSFPKRRCVLIGDTGEDDAAVYAGLAAEFPENVVFIAIRRVGNGENQVSEARRSLSGLPARKWMLFDDASELSAERIREAVE